MKLCYFSNPKEAAFANLIAWRLRYYRLNCVSCRDMHFIQPLNSSTHTYTVSQSTVRQTNTWASTQNPTEPDREADRHSFLMSLLPSFSYIKTVVQCVWFFSFRLFYILKLSSFFDWKAGSSSSKHRTLLTPNIMIHDISTVSHSHKTWTFELSVFVYLEKWPFSLWHSLLYCVGVTARAM